MNWIPFVTRHRYDAELAAAKAETNRQRIRAEKAEGRAATANYNRGQVLQQNAEQDAAIRRMHDRNLELGRRLSRQTEGDPDYAAQLERRVARLLKVAARLHAAGRGEQRRADHLQKRLDDALGLNTAAVLDGRLWQSTRTDGGGLKQVTP